MNKPSGKEQMATNEANVRELRVKILRSMFVACVNERRMQEAHALNAAIEAMDATQPPPTAAKGVAELLAKWRGSIAVCGHHLVSECDACSIRELHANELEAALSATQPNPEGDAELLELLQAAEFFVPRSKLFPDECLRSRIQARLIAAGLPISADDAFQPNPEASTPTQGRWAVDTPGADCDVSFVDKFDDALALAGGDVSRIRTKASTPTSARGSVADEVNALWQYVQSARAILGPDADTLATIGDRLSAIHDRLAASAAPLNQCDGCMSGATLDDRGFHRSPSGQALMMCQRERYAATPVVAHGEAADYWPLSAEELATWLDAKYARHHEDEDRQAASMLRALYAALASQPAEGQKADWRTLYRFERAMRFMDNKAALTREDAYRMADQDIASMERFAAETGKSPDRSELSAIAPDTGEGK